MNLLNRLLNECAQAQLAEGRCTVEDVTERAFALHAEIIDGESKALIYRQIKATVKRILGDLAENEDEPEAQQALPGLKLPSAIAVRKGDDIYYVRADLAVWDELMAGLNEREQNIVRAVVKRDQYQEAVDRLRVFMEDDPGCTVADALRREKSGN